MLMFTALCDDIRRMKPGKKYGQIVRSVGLTVEAVGLNVFVGERCRIFGESMTASVDAEVIGFHDDKTILMPFRNMEGISAHSLVQGLGVQSKVNVGFALVGRVINAFGEPLDDQGTIATEAQYPLRRVQAHNPLHRARIKQRLHTGIKVIDTLLPIGLGQRMGIFAGSGVGKSTLLGMCAQGEQEQLNVIVLVGERGREVVDFIEDRLGADGLSRSVVIVATSDEPPLGRSHAVFLGLAIAEYFCDQGRDVLFMLDSMTRFAMAHREIGLASGEPPTAKGYTPSVFSLLPEVLERTGNFKGKGSITALFTVLVEGDDITEPVTDTMRGILDGHIMLSRDIAAKGRFPAVDIGLSLSRLIGELVTEEALKTLNAVRRILAQHQELEGLIEIGAYEKGKDPFRDRILECGSQLEEVFMQSPNTHVEYDVIMANLEKIIENAHPAA
ncbi:FliI/YscN family ATPase [Vibrio sp. MEBiC08052]|uniref:FliI/YscN family ATPase n=1 Tax=Vibrio sp. MEBiC08052 TaxID=1761910 RepID=UPI0007407860|nr:FliI/YscN family ATPase [Vibrio sp. MEBiC08052]KUI97017.1 hypothetical protein VRK_38720 [Vibrio sp. MEBiC08052]